MTNFVPSDPSFDARVRASFAKQQVMHSLGVVIERVAPGEVELSMPYAAGYTQQHGYIHAGIMTTVLDSACGYAAFSLMPVDAEVLTIEFKTNLLAPAKGARFRVRGHVVKAGRTITVCDGNAYAVEGGAEKLIATMSATLMTLHRR